MNERRVSTRQKSFLQGRIYYNGRRSSVDCLVRDISELGAKLKFAGAVTLPDVLDLHIPAKDESYKARIQWRFGNEVGVAFGDEPAREAAADGKPTDLVARVARLEKELATLARRFNELQTGIRVMQGTD